MKNNKNIDTNFTESEFEKKKTSATMTSEKINVTVLGSAGTGKTNLIERIKQGSAFESLIGEKVSRAPNSLQNSC